MTNRNSEYTITLTEPDTPEDEVLYLARLLPQMGRPVTLDQAKELLSFALENAPGAWLISLADLERLWVVVVEPVLEPVKKAA